MFKKYIAAIIIISIICITAGCINTPPIYSQEELSEKTADSVVSLLKETADDFQ